MSCARFEILLPDPAAAEALGARLAGALAPGDALLLSGELGAGKTTLARGLIAAWTGAETDAPSPTYTLVQTYTGARGELAHLDLYRIERESDLEELGLSDLLDTCVCAIEWPQRLGRLRPASGIEVRLRVAGEGRSASLEGFGAAARRLEGAMA